MEILSLEQWHPFLTTKLILLGKVMKNLIKSCILTSGSFRRIINFWHITWSNYARHSQFQAPTDWCIWKTIFIIKERAVSAIPPQRCISILVDEYIWQCRSTISTNSTRRTWRFSPFQSWSVSSLSLTLWWFTSFNLGCNATSNRSK